MKISIRWALILGFLGLIWGTQIVIATSSYLSSQRVLLHHARDIMQNIADLTMEQSKNHLSLAQGAAYLTKRLMSSNVVGSDLSRQQALERYFLDQLAIYPHFAGIYIGLPNGDFFYVNRSDQFTAQGYKTKIISHEKDGLKQTRLIWRDHQGQLIAQRPDPADNYDPRQRPWYIKALKEKDIVWTDPYIFFTSQKPGITIAGPIFDKSDTLQAIVGVDIEIDQLSVFISKLRIGKNGRAFMLNNNGDVVAFPDPEKIRFSDDSINGQTRLVKIEELNDGLSQAAFKAVNWQHNADGRLKLTAPCFARFSYDGQAYHVMFTPFTSHHWPWIIGVYVPESDYLGGIQANRRFNLVLTLGLSVLATLAGLLAARAIIQPLGRLENEALAIQHNDLAPRPPIRSVFQEIEATTDAFALMKKDIRAGEEKYRAIFENIQDVYYEATFDGFILEVSPSIYNISDYTRNDLVGNPMTLLYKNPQNHKDLIEKIVADGLLQDYEITMIGKKGVCEICSVNACLKRDKNGEPEKIIGSLRVITDRKRADLELRLYQEKLEDLVHERTLDLMETNKQLRSQVWVREQKEKELLKSEEKYRSIIENMENGYFEVDLKGSFTFFNDPLTKILGTPRDRLQGMNYTRFMLAETAEKARIRFNEIRQSGHSEKLIQFNVIRPDGCQRTLDSTVSLMTDNNGRATGFRGVVMDVTERLTAELEKKRMDERLQQIQRLEGIGTLAGGVAHDFNNLLMGIQGNVSLMLLTAEPNDSYYDKLKSIESCVQCGSDLTRQLLGFARGGKYLVRPLDFNEVLQNTAQMFGRTRKEIRIHEKIDPDIWTVMADRNQIEQVLLNLYINAWQAMPEGGHIYLETKNMELDDAFAQTFHLSAGRYVCISVADTGIGIPKAIQPKIFEPFFTTKEIGRGTGLGLASAYGVIKNHGGAIDFSTRDGQGTTFYVYLPASNGTVLKASTKEPHLATGTETILLVDDEKVILDVTQIMLETLGYHVILAEGGKQAIALYNQNYGRIDLVILDVIMPDLGGGAVYDHLKTRKADVKVLLSSGYSISGQVEDILNRGCAGFIQKPFNIQNLSEKIREVLDESGTES